MYCPYCCGEAELVTGQEVYPHRPDLAHKYFYRCPSCDAYVGCHPGTTKPLGRIANASLRKAKQRAHKSFDPLWKTGRMKRGQAYAWLAQQLGIPKQDCHISMFDEDTCDRVVKITAAQESESYE